MGRDHRWRTRGRPNATAVLIALVYGMLVSACGEETPSIVAPPETEPGLPEPDPTPPPGWSVAYPAGDQPHNIRMLALWGTGPDRVFAVGCDPIAIGGASPVLMDLGSGWHLGHEVDWCPQGVWATAEDVFVVGGATLRGTTGGRVTHFDGSSWRSVTLPQEADFALHGVWGSSGSNVFAVGSDGNIVRYDGSGWTKMFSGTLVQLNAVWGSGPTDVWAVGAQGVIMRYDGTAWTAVASPTTEAFTGIWGTAPDNVFAVAAKAASVDGVAGRYAYVFKYDGEAWTHIAGPTFVRAVRGIAGLSAELSGVYFAGGWKHTNGRGLDMPFIAPHHRRYTRRDAHEVIYYGGIWGGPHTGLYMLGEEATILKLAENGRWEVSHGLAKGHDVWASASGSTAIRVGAYGSVLRYDGSGWRMMSTPTYSTIHAVWGASENDIYAVTDGAELLHFDGTEWADITNTLPSVPDELIDVDGRSANDVYLTAATGTSRRLLRFDGTTWADDPTFPDTVAAGGLLWVGATDGIVLGGSSAPLHYTGGEWVQQTATGAVGEPWGSDPDYLLSPGQQFDGQRWLPWQVMPADTPYDVWGSSADDVYAVGSEGSVYGRTGTGGGWDLLFRADVGGLYPDLVAVAGGGNRRFAVGARNVIVEGVL